MSNERPLSFEGEKKISFQVERHFSPHHRRDTITVIRRRILHRSRIKTSAESTHFHFSSYSPNDVAIVSHTPQPVQRTRLSQCDRLGEDKKKKIKIKGTVQCPINGRHRQIRKRTARRFNARRAPVVWPRENSVRTLMKYFFFLNLIFCS